MSEPSPAQLEALRRAAARLDAARAEGAELEEKEITARAEVAQRQQEVAEMEARAATANQLAAARERLTLAQRTHHRAATALDELGVQIDRERDDIDVVINQIDDPLTVLDGRVPVALLPVRIETRYISKELRIRIYPDVLHVDQLEHLLTAEEQAWGQAYWQERRQLQAPDDLAALWTRLTAGQSAQRAAWILEQTTPLNVDALARQEPQFPTLMLRPLAPSRAPRAHLLPAQWLVLGYRGGAEVLRKRSGFVTDPLQLGPHTGAGTVPTTDSGDTDLPDTQPSLGLDGAARWITDYDAAVAAGMAVTVPANEIKGGLGPRIDQLIVVGIDHRRTPNESAAQLESALQTLRFTAGLSFVGAGAPTNAGEGDDIAPRPAIGDPRAAETATAASSAGVLAARALGLPAGTTLARVAGAATTVNHLTADLHTVVWEPTLGYFLRQVMAPLVSDSDIDKARDHFVRFVRPAGPLPLLRVGRQPYGLLPVIAPSQFRGDAAETAVARALTLLRPMWAHAAREALQLGASGDPAADLVTLLERTSRSAEFRVREVFGPGVKANTAGGQAQSKLQQAIAEMILTTGGIAGRPAIVDMTAKERAAVLPVPLVTGHPLSETDPLTPDYLQRVAERLAGPQALSLLAQDAKRAATLLDALVVHAAMLELVRGTTTVVVKHLDLDIPMSAALHDQEILLPEDHSSKPTRRVGTAGPVEIESEGTAGARISRSALEIADSPLTAVSGTATLANHLTSQTIFDLQHREASRQLGQFRASLGRLAGTPTANLHRTTTDALDALSHRFDAWATSLATRRLDALRGAVPEGIHVGAFGWVEGLRKSGRPPSQGYVHGPSLAHATTAAVLRSGHLARSEGKGSALSIDLRSHRMRGALQLVEGLRSGQSLGALLGYRFERNLRDRGVQYARYILPTRRRYPLPEATDSRLSDQPVEAIEASNVADGLRLAQLDAAGRKELLDHIKAAASHRAGLTAELDALADAIDAVGDLIVSESVFQTVLGNTERAAAALEALDRQVGIPEVAIARTPRTGTGLGHRLIVLLNSNRPPSSWNRLVDHPSRAEPRVNAWVARVLGDPGRFVLAADVVGPDGETLETLTVTLRDLGMSALSVVLAASHGSEDVSQLEERLAQALAAKATSPNAAGLRAHPGPPDDAPPHSAGLGELMSVCRRVADLLSSARPAITRDLAPGSEPVDTSIDITDLQRRADTLRRALERIAGIDPSAASLTKATLMRALRSAADLGLRGALPRSSDRDSLRAQLLPVIQEAAGRLRELDVLEGSAAAPRPGPDSNGDSEQQAQLHTQRIQQVLGADFPVVPRLRLPTTLSGPLTASEADPELLAGDRLAPAEWIMRHARVRPSVERLWSVLTEAERRGTHIDGSQFAVAQLPHRPGERWIGLPFRTPGTGTTATTSIVLHRPGNRDAATPLRGTIAALLVDQWHERVPNPTETTGITFHFDAPGARPPQSILLAVPPTPDAARWSTDAVVATIREAAQLTRMRTLDLDDIPGAGRALPATYFAFNLEDDVPSMHLRQVVETSLSTWPMMKR